MVIRPREVKSLLSYHLIPNKRRWNLPGNHRALTLGESRGFCRSAVLFLMILLVFCCHYKSPREIRIMIFSWLFLKVLKCHLGLQHSDSVITSNKIPYVNCILPMLGCNSLVPRYPTILTQKVETKMVRQKLVCVNITHAYL